jgi:hypothetical protein
MVRAMENEAWDVLKGPERNLYERIRARFAPIGGVDLELPPREPAREPPHFEGSGPAVINPWVAS